MTDVSKTSQEFLSSIRVIADSLQQAHNESTDAVDLAATVDDLRVAIRSAVRDLDLLSTVLATSES